VTNLISAPDTLDISLVDSLFSVGEFSDIVPKRKPISSTQHDTSSNRQEEDDDNDDGESDSKLFTYPVEGCVKSFQRYTSLDRHLQCGKCQLQQEKLSVMDKSKLVYQEKLLSGNARQPAIPIVSAQLDAEVPPTLASTQGWALKAVKKSVRFSRKQKEYLDEMFNYGQETGHKRDPNDVATEMRYAKDLSGNRRFEFNEFLSATQISSYFSRKAAKLKKGTTEPDTNHEAIQETTQAAEEETNYHLARNAIIESCQLQHPVLYESIDLCQLFKSNKLNKLSLTLLKSICTDLELGDEATYRRKAPYIDLIAGVLQACECSKSLSV